MDETSWGWLIVIAGVFSFLGAITNWEIFSHTREGGALFFRRLIGPTGFRIFQFVVGIAMIAVGLYLTETITF